MLGELYPRVQFIPTYRTMELTFGKPLICISAVLDWLKELDLDNYLIINSDIELRTDKALIVKIESQMPARIIMGNRINYFETVVNLFTSIGYFNDQRDNYGVFQNVYNALKPKGVFVIDFFKPAIFGKQPPTIQQKRQYQKEGLLQLAY